ncbi:hypothetical protein ACFZCP_40805 [Streptomyces sp. NPDC007971]|uniref:hypothetical protein n=1 Tax=Streptomyces sp. NPDC007971 TaxID=3364799 RepID=UPI0036E81A23
MNLLDCTAPMYQTGSLLFRRLPCVETAPRVHTAVTGALRTREPIYAQLVEEWQAQGRTVPAEPDGLWAALAGLAPRTRPESERS